MIGVRFRSSAQNIYRVILPGHGEAPTKIVPEHGIVFNRARRVLLGGKLTVASQDDRKSHGKW
jgi:hypothetical protein